ncbi:hypothetical protein ACH5AO_04370 [Streptomyces sp. NPDC018964]|uniref:hypothetical protein n=1 Tax=Streptomyces sp. NPDC018964 TaxID=3365058 RepID=UPI0037A81641
MAGLQVPAHGAGARRLCGAACLLSAPRLAAPGGALAICGHEMGKTLCGWGGRLHKEDGAALWAFGATETRVRVVE